MKDILGPIPLNSVLRGLACHGLEMRGRSHVGRNEACTQT